MQRATVTLRFAMTHKVRLEQTVPVGGLRVVVHRVVAKERDMGLIDGAKALLEGFGETPPPQEVAQARSDVCTGGLNGNKCAANYLGGWAISDKIAQALHAQRQRKLELKLTVEREERLGTCEICRCWLPLKVWYDEGTILGHTTDSTLATMKETNPKCWIAALQKQHQTP